jgi:hypothetical protein
MGESHRVPIARAHLDWPHRHSGAIVKLQPKRPPGRADRKGAAYASEIVQLRVAGYTYEAIREAFAELGIELTESTLRREVRRQQKRVDGTMPDLRSPSPASHDPALPEAQTLTAAPPPSNAATGREVAEAFFNAHPSNPLFSTKETS